MTVTTAPDQAPQPKFRKDYAPPHFDVESVELEFDLGEDGTEVTARVAYARREGSSGQPLVLVGEELETLRVAVDGRELAASEFEAGPEALVVPAVPDRFVLETAVRIHPESNTTLMGLYRSSGNFCTQCEAEGFRRITWFLDRPDVMSTYRVTITADEAKYPVLLSNGNRLSVESLGDGRHRSAGGRRREDASETGSETGSDVLGDAREEEEDRVFLQQQGDSEPYPV